MYKVYAYEPFVENFTFLKENVEINNLKNVNIYNLAVAGKKGKRKLFIGKESDWPSFFMEGRSKVHIEVDCITVEDIFDSNEINKCDLLKLNCEGAEYEILFNTPRKCFKKLGGIGLELHNNFESENLIKFLGDRGFKMRKQAIIDSSIRTFYRG